MVFKITELEKEAKEAKIREIESQIDNLIKESTEVDNLPYTKDLIRHRLSELRQTLYCLEYNLTYLSKAQIS